MEQAVVSMVDKRTIGIARKALGEYQPGRNILVQQGGRVVSAAVLRASYDATSAKTYVIVNASVENTIHAVYIDETSTHCGGNDEKTCGLFHFEDNTVNADLYDVSIGTSYQSGTSNVTAYGTAPTRANANAKFGSKCLNLAGTGLFALNNCPIPTAGPWTCEASFYGKPTSGIFTGAAGHYSNGWQGGTDNSYWNSDLGFNGSGQPYALGGITITSSVALSANAWNAVAWSYDGTKVYIHVNGILTASGAISFVTADDTILGKIGGRRYLHKDVSSPYFTCDSYLAALVDEVRLTNRCLYTVDYTIPSKPFGPDFR